MTSRLSEFLGEIYSVIIALVRIIFLTAAMVTSAVHVALFARTEICNIELKGMPWRCDRLKEMQNLAFIDKICIENPDLLDYADEYPDVHSDDDDDEDI